MLFVILPPPTSTLFPYTTLFRSAGRLPARRAVRVARTGAATGVRDRRGWQGDRGRGRGAFARPAAHDADADRKSTRLNSSHVEISYAVFCLKKKKKLKPASQLNP